MKKIMTTTYKRMSTLDHCLQKSNLKVTRARKALVDIFDSQNQPISVPEIIEKLKDKKVAFNKTTIYREIDVFLKNNFITKVDLAPRITHYESALQSHHHHIVCIECGNIDKVESEELEDKMSLLIKNLHKLGYKNCNHKLEFSGVCANCK